jgi:protein-L-isoaspartate O-methyltransferase
VVSNKPEDFIAELLTSLEKGGIRSWPRVDEALRAVPRHGFIDQDVDTDGSVIRISPDGPSFEQLKNICSNDAELVRSGGAERTSSSAPYPVLWMIRLLDLDQSRQVLEIGTGTGWNAGPA